MRGGWNLSAIINYLSLLYHINYVYFKLFLEVLLNFKNTYLKIIPSMQITLMKNVIVKV